MGVREEVPGFPLSVLEVRDHGPGIHGEDRERVFERFYRTELRVRVRPVVRVWACPLWLRLLSSMRAGFILKRPMVAVLPS